MKVKIDFRLNNRLGIVESIIFRLVLNGYANPKELSRLLPLFSDSVLANGIKNLVNRQILSVHIEREELSISEPLVAIINMCLEKSFDIMEDSNLKRMISGEGLIISDAFSKDAYDVKQTILHELVPGVKLDMYADSIDFVVFEENEQYEGRVMEGTHD